MIYFQETLMVFGGINFKSIDHKTENSEFEVIYLKKRQPLWDKKTLNTLNDMWIFDLKDRSWHMPLVGGNFPRKGLDYSLINLSEEKVFKALFLSRSKLKFKAYDIYSSGEIIS